MSNKKAVRFVTTLLFIIFCLFTVIPCFVLVTANVGTTEMLGSVIHEMGYRLLILLIGLFVYIVIMTFATEELY